MNIVVRLARLLMGKPDCPDCGRYNPRLLHGNYWHADTCPWVQRPPRYPSDWADE